MYDFANLLFSGVCSARCTFCIGQQIDPGIQTSNLNTYPPRNLEAFLKLIRQYGIRQLVLTGSNTDPQLYRYEGPLLVKLRRELSSGVQISLHTNGLQARHRMQIWNQYDRVTISIPSFDPGIYRRMMGSQKPPDLEAILRRSTVPVKVSCIVTSENKAEVPAFASRCARLGVHRLVLRKLFGEALSWQALLPELLADPRLLYSGSYRSNPVYRLEGMQVTLWDFNQTRSRSINLFSSGWISEEYLLGKASPARNHYLPSEANSGTLVSR